ncbi:hypothetical protein [Mesorhizobium koreense]|uniref:hypothetical protein n=1 Tax=Mesorhizobium koreense TaxID=3074855 RepID=UPI00287B7A70|nr:hypothetical protein [Mesorhizobium sp. WR6]
MFRSLTTAAAMACTAMFPAFAQDLMANRQIMRPGQTSTVQSTFNSTTALDETSDVTAQQIGSLRNFYKIAAASCAEVLATVADQCEISRITTSVNIMERGTRGRHLSVNGTVVMNVEFKKPGGTTSP